MFLLLDAGSSLFPTTSAPKGMRGRIPVARQAAHAAAPETQAAGRGAAGASLPASHAASPAPFLPEINSTSARVLLFLVVPGHLIFFSIIYLVEGQSVPNDTTFVGLYLLAGLVQVTMAPGVPSWERSLDTQDTVPTFWKSSQSIQAQGRDQDALLQARVDFSQAVFRDSSWEGWGLCRVTVGSGGHSHEGGVSVSVTLKDRLRTLGDCPEQRQGSGCGNLGPGQGLRCLHEGPAGRSCASSQTPVRVSEAVGGAGRQAARHTREEPREGLGWMCPPWCPLLRSAGFLVTRAFSSAIITLCPLTS